MITSRRHRLLAWCLSLLAALTAADGEAHPMGNFSVAHATSLQLDGRFLRFRYRLDLAEAPAAGEMREIDTDHDGKVSDDEARRYLDRAVPQLTAAQTLRLNGRPATLEVISGGLQQRPGAADAPTLLITIDYVVTVDRDRPLRVDYEDRTWPGRSGWREISARAWAGWRIGESDVPTESPTALLDEYPTDVNATPPRQTTARVVFKPVTGTTRPDEPPRAGSPAAAASKVEAVPRAGWFATLLRGSSLFPAVVITALLLAIGLGAFLHYRRGTRR